jgi:predicted nucleotidyltransferase
MLVACISSPDAQLPKQSGMIVRHVWHNRSMTSSTFASEAVRYPLPSDALAAHKEEVIAILNEVGASNIRVFGSVARGEDRYDSDIDLLVDLPESIGIFTIAGVWGRIKDLLGCEVDLVPANSLKPRMVHVIEEAYAL